MKHQGMYEDYRRLAWHGEIISYNPDISEHWSYIDPLECDLQLYWSNVLHIGSGEMKESMNVFLGGRKVYAFYEDEPGLEWIVHGHWEHLVSELRRYELAVDLEERYNVSGTLVELCRRESARNRKFLTKYRELCLLLAKRGNRASATSKGTLCYVVEKTVDGHEIKIHVVERIPRDGILSYDSIDVFFDKRAVFSFHYNCSNVGGLFDEKGHYVSGEWERTMERMTE